MNLTTQQLAEILIGVARAQQAIIDAVEGVKPGFKGTYLAPALDAVAKIRSTGRALTFQELPARILLQCQARTGPNAEQIVKDIEALLAGQGAASMGTAPAAARAAAAQPPNAVLQAPAPSAPGAGTTGARPGAAAATRPAAGAPVSGPAPATGEFDDDLDMTKM